MRPFKSRYEIDHHAFDVASEERDYWAGFICADGWVHPKGVAIQLASADRAHLVKFRTFLKSTYPITHMTTTGPPGHRERRLPADRIRITSREISASLGRLGLGVKSLGRKACDELKTSRHFWRGVVDGDGTIGVYTTKGPPTASFSLCGGKELIAQFQDFISESGIPTRTQMRKVKTLYLYTLNHTMAALACRLLYTDARVFLDRKLLKACHVIETHLEDALV